NCEKALCRFLEDNYNVYETTFQSIKDEVESKNIQEIWRISNIYAEKNFNIQSQGSIDNNTVDEHQAISEGKDYNDAVIKYQAILEEEDKNNIVQVILKRENEANDVDKHYAILEENKTDDSDNETLDNEANNIQLSQKIQNLPHIVGKG
ncbi:33557_t:CDS:2, partial [Gigaspora margarita]